MTDVHEHSQLCMGSRDPAWDQEDLKWILPLSWTFLHPSFLLFSVKEVEKRNYPSGKLEQRGHLLSHFSWEPLNGTSLAGMSNLLCTGLRHCRIVMTITQHICRW